jgi:hypothetical protein
MIHAFDQAYKKYMSKGQSVYVQSKKFFLKKMGPRKDPWKLRNEDTPHANDDFASMLDASNIN